jgi:hypothetical protein
MGGKCHVVAEAFKAADEVASDASSVVGVEVCGTEFSIVHARGEQIAICQ